MTIHFIEANPKDLDGDYKRIESLTSEFTPEFVIEKRVDGDQIVVALASRHSEEFIRAVQQELKLEAKF